MFRPKGEGYAGINVKAGMQALMNKDGRHYDRVEYTVTAFPETDWNALKEDWKSHGGYKGDPEGGLKHLMLRQSKIVTFKTVGYFDISRFFGKCDRSLFAK